MKHLILLLCASTLIFCGCKTTTNSDGTPISTYDPVKTQQLKDALTPVVSGGIRRIILNSPGHDQELCNYFRAVGSVFCEMSKNGEFSPIILVNAIDSATAELQTGIDPYAVDIKNATVAIYKIYYGDRFRAELPPDKWPKNVCDVICDAIDLALRDLGKTGIK